MGVDDTVQKLEKLRRKILVLKYAPILLIAAGVLMLVLNGTYIFGLVSIGAGLLFVVFFRCQVPFLRTEYKTIYKDTFVRPVLSTVFEHIEYDWNRGFTEMWVRSFGLAQMGNRFHSEDYIRAVYKGVQFRQADVVIENETVHGTRYDIRTYFRGRMFEFDFVSKMVGSVKVYSKGCTGSFEPLQGRLEMDNAEFNSQFTVFSSNAHEAFYILTPFMMEKLVAISRRYPIVGFRFAPGKLYVGVGTDDSFDAKIGRRLSYSKEQERIKRDVQVIIDMIEMIDLIRDDQHMNHPAAREEQKQA